MLAKSSLDRQSKRADHPGEDAQAEMAAEEELEHGNEAEVVEYGNDCAELPDELDLVDDEAQVVEHDNDFAEVPAEDELAGNQDHYS